MLASDCTMAIGTMKKNVRKKNATDIISLRTLRWTYGIARLGQYTSRGSGAQSVNQIVGFLVWCVCAQTAAPHRVLKETKAAGMIDFGSCSALSLSSAIWHEEIIISQLHENIGHFYHFKPTYKNLCYKIKHGRAQWEFCSSYQIYNGKGN